MKTKYALINTFNAMPGRLGGILSFHRTEEAAEKADRAFQKAVQRANGKNCYLPTIIREVDGNAPFSNDLHESWVYER